MRLRTSAIGRAPPARLADRPDEALLQQILADVLYDSRMARTGMTLEQLGEEVGLTLQHLSKFETGGTVVSTAKLIKIAWTLGTTPEAIMAEVVERYRAKTAAAPAPDHPGLTRDTFTAVRAVRRPEHLRALTQVARAFGEMERRENAAGDRDERLDRADLGDLDPDGLA